MFCSYLFHFSMLFFVRLFFALLLLGMYAAEFVPISPFPICLFPERERERERERKRDRDAAKSRTTPEPPIPHEPLASVSNLCDMGPACVVVRASRRRDRTPPPVLHGCTWLCEWVSICNPPIDILPVRARRVCVGYVAMTRL